ncbi:MAG TPA: adenylate cyclase regulatory domain-containing protein [Solirubrobacterales bacterium]|jgi:adenylate cyclase|nr:adenylate cyclase regulatory domain-containing protein [Solirubrobacterales bacterium]
MIDFEAEGLLEGLEGEAREARLQLLQRLEGEGVPLKELREAVEGGRLALLPVERAVAGDGARYTPREVAEKVGIDLEILQRTSAALGVPYPDPDERSVSEVDLEAAQRVKAFYDAGLPEEGMMQVARTVGMATARIAEANRDLVIRTLMQPGDTERDLALRFAAAAEHMLPLFEPTLSYAFRAHMLEQIRRDVLGAGEIASGQPGTATDVSVCFADLVGFTKLGEQVETEELGLIAGRLDELATAVAEPPVRLVKLIGDAAMLVSTDAAALVEAALRMVEAADAEGEDFPRLRAGIAHGSVHVQAGDYYGRPVNLASRLTAIAKPGSVLVDDSAREAAGEGFAFSFAGERRLKGFDSRTKLYRTRRARVK